MRQQLKQILMKIKGRNSHIISPTFCVYPWMELMLGPSSNIRLCCIADKDVKDENGESYNLEATSIKNYWNSYGLRQVRRKMLLGEKVDGCKACDYLESSNKLSYRRLFAQYWLTSPYKKDILHRIKKSKKNGYRVEDPPIYYDIRPGNLCNLQCRMCHSANSSKLYQEQKELLKTNALEFTPLIDQQYIELDPKKYLWHKNQSIWTELYKQAGSIKELYFTGGEPTLIKENWQLIDFLKEKGFSKNIKLKFNINCTYVPDKLIETFKDFRHVEICFSVDGYRETQEYIRHPSRFNEIEKNIIKILKKRRQNCYFQFTPVIQIYNILDLPRFFNWVDELKSSYGDINIHTIICRWPEFLNISILPKKIKEIALLKIEEYEKSSENHDTSFINDLNGIKDIMKIDKPDANQKLKQFYSYTKILDKKRGNNFSKTFPELNQLLNESRQ